MSSPQITCKIGQIGGAGKAWPVNLPWPDGGLLAPSASEGDFQARNVRTPAAGDRLRCRPANL